MAKQLKLEVYKGKRGGRRPGSGRKRLHSKGVAHRPREDIRRLTPVHINFKVSTYIQNKPCLKILLKAIENAQNHGLNIVYFSLQSNHVHLIGEAVNTEDLTRAMRSLTITFAKGVKDLKHLQGPVQIERYHLHLLKTKNEVLNAFTYVKFNQTHHTSRPINPSYSRFASFSQSFLLSNLL